MQTRGRAGQLLRCPLQKILPLTWSKRPIGIMALPGATLIAKYLQRCSGDAVRGARAWDGRVAFMPWNGYNFEDAILTNI